MTRAEKLARLRRKVKIFRQGNLPDDQFFDYLAQIALESNEIALEDEREAQPETVH